MSEGALVSEHDSDTFQRGNTTIYFQHAERLYDEWPSPTCIIADGPYGLSGFPGDLPTVERLAEWYRPHVHAWAERSTPQTTLWFWNSELGWATWRSRAGPQIIIPAEAGMAIKRVGQREFDGGVGIPRCLSRSSFLRMQESRRHRAGCEGRT